MSDLTIGKTRRGLAVYAPTHPSYTHLEATHTVGADAHYLGQLARQAQPSYRAVDHEEAAALHYVRRNFHAARAHDAASQAMSKALALGEARDTPQGIVPAYASDLAWVYQGADPQLTLPDAAAAIQAVTLGWTAQDHIDNAVAQHCLAQAHGDDPSPKAAKRQALCAAAAYMHFAAAGVNPTTGPVGQSLNKARPHKYVSRERKGDTWVYTYPDDLKVGSPAHAAAAAAPQAAPPPSSEEAPAAKPRKQTKDEQFKEMLRAMAARQARLNAEYGNKPHGEPGTPRGDAHAATAGKSEPGPDRKTLAAAHPLKFDRHLNAGAPLTAVLAHFVMQHFPEHVPDKAGDTEERKKKRQAEYTEAYGNLAKAIAALKDDATPAEAVKAIQRALDPVMDRSRQVFETSKYADPLHQELYDFLYKDVLGRKKTSLASTLDNISEAATHSSKSKEEHTAHVTKLAREYMASGGSSGVPSATHSVVRKGPAVKGADTAEGQAHMLSNVMKMHRVVFSKSMSNEDREHHQKNLALSFHDLADVTGLPEEMCSYNGRLQLNVGAKNKTSAKAFYLPSDQAITLSADQGAGSLAHEWGHFFDNILSEVTGGKKGTFVTDRVNRDRGDGHADGDGPENNMHKAVAAVMQHPAMDEFIERMENDKEWRAQSSANRKYWGSPTELWARCFERHVAHKLAKKGQENTYLVNNSFSYLWPTEDEVAKMAPAFDAVFAEAKKGGHINKALAALAFGQLGKRWYKATPSELADVIRKAIHPRALTPSTPRKPTQIGTTRSGKPIFDIYHHPAHKGFDAKDWADAGKAVGAMMAHRKAVGAAKRVPVTKSVMSKAGGSKVIGHTGDKAGHDVLSSTSAAYRSSKFETDGRHGGRTQRGEKARSTAAARHVMAKFPHYGPEHHAEAARIHAEHGAKTGSSAKVANIVAAHTRAAAEMHRGALPPSAAEGKKTGEGSRGGDVIGHTKVGNHPIYAAHHHTYDKIEHAKITDEGLGRNEAHVKAAHPHFTSRDHSDAAEAHQAEESRQNKLAYGASRAKDKVNAEVHRNIAKKHFAIGAAHEIAAYRIDLEKSSPNNGFDAKDWADAGKAVGAMMAHRKAVGAAKRVPVTKSVIAKAEGGDDDHPHIGTTSSGKKVYGVNHPGHAPVTRRLAHEDNVKAVRKMYPGFTAKDHQEAAYVHRAVRSAHFRDREHPGKSTHVSSPTSTKHFYLIQAHLKAAHKLSGNQSKPQPTKPKGFEAPSGHGHGEGSRGGHVIGHRKTSGAPIYATHGAAQEHYTGKLDEPAAKPKDAPARKPQAEDDGGHDEPTPKREGAVAKVLVNKGDPHVVAAKTRSGKDIHASHSGIYAGIKGGTGNNQDVHDADDNKNQSNSVRVVRNSHKHFTSADHYDAVEHHAKNVRQLEGAEKARAIAVAHGHKKVGDKLHTEEQLAEYAKKSMANPVLLLDLSKARGKGSRGGVIVGFAPNGSSIYSGHRVRSSKARKEAVAQAKKEDTNKSLGDQAFTIRG